MKLICYPSENKLVTGAVGVSKQDMLLPESPTDAIEGLDNLPARLGPKTHGNMRQG